MSNYQDMTIFVIDDEKVVLETEDRYLRSHSVSKGWECSIVPIQDPTLVLRA